MVIFPKICAILLSALSARSDIKNYKIPNDLLLSFLITALFSRIVMLDPKEIGDCLLGLAVPFLLLWVFFRFRKMGAGDIKLFCVLGAFMGPVNILWCMFYSFLCGGAAALLGRFAFGNAPGLRGSKVHVAVLTVPAVIMWAGGIYG